MDIRKATWALAALVASLSASSPARADSADALYRAGVRAYDADKYDKATTELEASIAARPTARAALYLGNAYLRRGELPRAKEALNLALKLDPKSAKRAAIVALISSIDGRTLAHLTVSSTPPGASIYLDSTDKPLGRAPITVPMTPGAHKVIATLDGYDSATQDQVVVAGDATSLTLDLVIKGCDVAVSASAPGARASREGGPPAALPATLRVPKGEHSITVSADRYDPQTLEVRCDGSHAIPSALAARLLIAKPKGRMRIPDEPGAVVIVDGHVMSASPSEVAAGIGLPAGVHEVTITAPNRTPWTTTVTVVAGANVDVAPPQPKNEGAPSIYFGVGGAGNLALRNWNLGSNAYVSQNGQQGLHPGTSAMGGLRAGIQALPRLGVEAEVYWVELPNQLDTSQGLSYDLNAVYSILDKRWTPIVEGGAGVYQVVAGKLGSDESARGHLGVGLRGRITDWLALRVDARDVVSRGFGGGPSDNVELAFGLEVVAWRKGGPAAGGTAIVIGKN